MKKNMILFIIFLIMLINIITFGLIFNFWDPLRGTEEVQRLALISISTTFILWLSSFFGLIIYFTKKLWYKWEIYVKNIFSSFRQGFFLSLLLSALIYFNSIWILEIKTISLCLIIVVLLEFTFKNLEK